MSKTKTIAINKSQIVSLIYFTALLAVSIAAPLFHFQPITGPIVNACLFIAAILLGSQAGVMIGLLPSLIALSVGTLPAVLSPMVPFIMVSNAVLVVVFAWCQTHVRHVSDTVKFGAAVVAASILKFLFLFSASYIVLHLISQKPVGQKAATMMGLSQLLTALAGGAIAWLILMVVKSKKEIK